MEENNVKQKRIIGFSLGIFILVVEALSIVAAIVLDKFGIVTEENKYMLTYIVNAASIYIVGYSILKLILRKVEIVENKEKQKLKITEILLLLCVTIGGTQFINIITQMILTVIKALLNIEINNGVADMLLNSNTIPTIIFAAIVGPIFEEFIFRGTLLKRLRVYGDKTAIIYTAIAFGLFHTNINQIPFAIACGLIFGYAMVKTNNIKWPIFLHIFLNSFSVLITIFTKLELAVPTLVMLLLIVLAIILTLIFVPIVLSTGKVKVSNESKYSKKNLYKNIGYIFTLIVIAIVTVVAAII